MKYKKGEQCIINTSSTLSNTTAIVTVQTKTDIKGMVNSFKYCKRTYDKITLLSRIYIFSLFSHKIFSLTTLIEGY